MEQNFNNVALIIAHPGHELRVFRFIELYKPRVYVLTDGAGSSGDSRLYNTIAILEKCGASISSIMGHYSDREIYRIMLEKDYLSLTTLVQKILLDFEEHNIQMVVGDAIEGYNPTHDLCRYLINLIVSLKEVNDGVGLSNFDFLLDGVMSEEEGDLVIQLDNADFERKQRAAEGYTELSKELESTIQKYGNSPFMVESLRKVQQPHTFSSWGEGVPFYEQYAREKVSKGVYDKAISFQEHLLPLIHHLSTNLSGRQ
ncbi:hypothetical protein CLV51_102194 [Chitinophaga niastensis]|uniref:GlcNAc-PI de-N-acetylase n=1 Tax=Chitinophaga niastensis TaxID=536980 RepID=A0A2P8HMA1_CHINA|nr:hypothetical protein [Chitinophaga niastensis]PSL47348.1 hypothetical protein CLV51_102194 [Chitinophaga niastensis]